MANVEALRDILAHAEGLMLPEGEYLRVANALQAAFNAPVQNVREIAKYKVVDEVKIEIKKNGEPLILTLLRQTRTVFQGPRMDSYDCEYSLSDYGGYLFVRSPFIKVVEKFLTLHQPKSVKISSKLGNITVTLARAKKYTAARYKSVKAAIDDMPGDVPEHFYEEANDCAHFTYCNFVQYVTNRIPMLDNLYDERR
jgi:hypothetical protein